jgi:light-regulated signal transduction histidine kinase (bacteriophytochrome)
MMVFQAAQACFGGVFAAWRARLGDFLFKLHILGKLSLLGPYNDNTAQQVKNIIRFDRIMTYHGEVVAESKNENLPPLLGLNYPASDIPKQARELYKNNLTRHIADVHSIPSIIITGPDQQDPIDLTFSQLRAVSPIHIQYLKNMKVDSSSSISIICHQELWGLIACHNYEPQFIDYQSRANRMRIEVFNIY